MLQASSNTAISRVACLPVKGCGEIGLLKLDKYIVPEGPPTDKNLAFTAARLMYELCSRDVGLETIHEIGTYIAVNQVGMLYVCHKSSLAPFRNEDGEKLAFFKPRTPPKIDELSPQAMILLHRYLSKPNRFATIARWPKDYATMLEEQLRNRAPHQ